MDFANENSNSWDWQGDDYDLHRDPQLGISTSLWDEVNQNEDDLLCMLEETTPVKACADIDFHIPATGEDLNKELEVCQEPSQSKRRRMLQFNNDEQISSAFIKMKDREISLMEDPVPDNLQWAPSFSAGCSSGVNAINQSSGGWLESCINDSEVHISCDEMAASGLSDDQVDISEFCNIPPEMETDTMQESLTPRSHCIFRGRKSVMRSPTKLATSIAYPFALIKPCGVQGDVTLKDINQRIRTPPPGPKDNKGDPSPSYPTSAFSGKPVVVKTKIRTEGGKGSITIMRTKG